MKYPLVNIQKAIENGPVEIVDLTIENGDFPVRYVSLPEGNSQTYFTTYKRRPKKRTAG